MANEFIKVKQEKNTLSHTAQNIDYNQIKNKWEANTSEKKTPLQEVLFCSTQRETTILFENKKTNDMEQIVFQNNHYLTNNAEHIKFLKDTDLFGVIIFADTFPEAVKREMEYDKHYLTTYDKEYE
jgi:hypothetical protein